MSTSELLTRIDQAFASNDNTGGLELLREYTVGSPHDASNWHRRAVIEEQIGDWEQAGECHYHCIQAAPAHATAYLYAGSWLQQNKNDNAAAACYSLAQEANPLILQLRENSHESEPTQIKSAHGDRLLRQFLSDQHRQLFSESGSRISQALWVQSHDQALNHANEEYGPELFFIPNITQKAFYEPVEFAWAANLTEQTKTIKEELDNALSNYADDLGLRPYLPEQLFTNPSLQHLVGSPNWSAIDLFKDGVLNQQTADKFSNTLGLLQNIPTYGIDEAPFEAFFSVLQPQNSIGSHFGQSNHSLTVHLGLDTPYGGYLEVAGEKRQWREGELLIFDDSYLHAAYNNSKHPRTVLLFSIWHPSLTKEERQQVQQAFKARKHWLESRRGMLAELRSK